MSIQEILDKNISPEQVEKIIDAYRPIAHEWMLDAYLYPLLYVLSIICAAKILELL